MNRFIAVTLSVLGLLAFGRISASQERVAAPGTEHPLIVQKNEGEVRVWRPLVSESASEQKIDKATRFTLKVDALHGGSPDFWFGTETLPPRGGIPYHRHLHEDEVLYFLSGNAHIHVGSLVGDAQPGATVFIPRNTWVSVQPIGKTPISLLFAFNAPGFDRYMRCESASLGRTAKPVSLEEDRHCTKLGDVQYR